LEEGGNGQYMYIKGPKGNADMKAAMVIWMALLFI